MARLTPAERNTDVLRPYGVFACIAPFNFPLAPSTGMSAAALVAGNTVVYKPAEDAAWTGLGLYEAYRDAGLPAGAFNLLTGHRESIGDALWQHPASTESCLRGSKAVGLRIHAGLAAGPWDQALPSGTRWKTPPWSQRAQTSTQPPRGRTFRVRAAKSEMQRDIASIR